MGMTTWARARIGMTTWVRMGMTTGVRDEGGFLQAATEKWPRISLRGKIVVNSLNYHPFYIHTLSTTICTLGIIHSF